MLFGAFLGPIIAVLLFNCTIFVLVIRVLIKHSQKKFGNKHRKDKKTVENVKRLLISVFGIMFLFGLTWLFGALTISDASLAFQFLFAIFNSLQGFFIFLFFCVLGKEARELWLQFLCRGRKIKWITSTSESTQPRKGGAPVSSSGVSTSTTGVKAGTRFSSLASMSFLRRPSKAPSVGEDSVSTVEMNPMGSTIANLHVIQEEDEEEVEDSYTQGSVELSQNSGYDMSRSSTHELLSEEYSRRGPSSEIPKEDPSCAVSSSQSDGAISLEEGTGSVEQNQDVPGSEQNQNIPSSVPHSDGDSEIIENHFFEL